MSECLTCAHTDVDRCFIFLHFPFSMELIRCAFMSFK